MTFTTTLDFRIIYLEYVDFKSEISELSAHLNYFSPNACFLSSRTDLLCSPRIAAGEALSLVTHLILQGKQEL